MESEQWQRVIDINLTGVWNSCKAEAELMLESGGGSIINIASMSGIIVNRGLDQAHYNCSKAGVIHLSKSLAMEWVGKGIRVNSISPGYIRTEMTGTVREDWQEYWISTIPFKRMGTPEELAGAVIYLLSDASTYTSGLDMIIDGCFTIV